MVLVASAGAAVTVGCASYSHIRFEPNPLDVRLSATADAPAAGRALVSVRGIREAPQEGWELVIRLRLDNDQTGPIAFLAEECELVDGALNSFPAPRVRREGDAAAGDRIGAGGTAIFDLTFPFSAERSPDDFDLSGLSLHWAVEVGDQVLHQSSTFERQARQFPGGGYGYPYTYRYYHCHPWLGYHYHRGHLWSRH